ncbi:MAG: T9SS type A sorting domain-containing protein, partial [Lewinella sp.]|nr:T9SS type A sorting domain-containing protein [Lewinella sp.]
PLRPMPEPQFETVDEPGIELWPNPATGEAFMDMDSAWGNKVTVEATDNLGRRVKEWNFDPTADSRLTLDMTNQPPGVYFIRVRNQAGRTTTLRLVVTRP